MLLDCATSPLYPSPHLSPSITPPSHSPSPPFPFPPHPSLPPPPSPLFPTSPLLSLFTPPTPCRVDSITWDSHKMMTVPLYCSALLVQHKGLLAKCNSAHATYLFQKDKVAYDTSLDTGDQTIQCGRVNDALKFWLMWKAMVQTYYMLN